MAEIPSLFQLCAEIVTMTATKCIKLRTQLKQMVFPHIIINYIHKRKYKSNSFTKLIKSHINSMEIVHSKPKVGDNFEFRITVGDERSIWISTLGDLGIDMLKLDFIEGEYGLFPFENGYLIRKAEYSPRFAELAHIFNSGNNEKGLTGTYHYYPVSSYRNHMTLFNFHISEYMHDKDWWVKYTGFKKRTFVETIEPYNNIPVLFYLTKPINLEDIGGLTLTFRSEISNCGNVEVCWYVEHCEKGRIGIAVMQDTLFNMVPSRIGMGLLRTDKFRAVGNFQVCDDYRREERANPMVFVPRHRYSCEFYPCYCDYSYAISKQSTWYISRTIVPGEEHFTVKYRLIGSKNTVGEPCVFF